MRRLAIWGLWKLNNSRQTRDDQISKDHWTSGDLCSGFYPGHCGCYCVHTMSCFIPHENKCKQATNLFRLVTGFVSLFCRWQLKSQFISLGLWVCPVYVGSGPVWDLWSIHIQKWKNPLHSCLPSRIPPHYPGMAVTCDVLWFLQSQRWRWAFHCNFSCSYTLCRWPTLRKKTYTHQRTLTHVLVASLDFDSPQQVSAFIYSSESSTSCFYILSRINNYQDDRWFVEIFYLHKKLFLFEM